MKLVGKTVLLTGASRGIGLALARQLAQSGCQLLLTALEEDELSAISKELTKLNINIHSFAVDLSDIDQRHLFLNKIKQSHRDLDILINNAGIGGQFGRFVRQDWDDIQRIISLNILASLHLTRELIPLLKKRPQAKIVNISSGVARLPYAGLAVYGASKGFISSFSESLACELYNTNIKVLCFHPAFTDTPFIKSSQMDLQHVPQFMIHSAEKMAKRIIRAIKKDRLFVFSDTLTTLSTLLGILLPERLKIYLFKDIFWRLPDEE